MRKERKLLRKQLELLAEQSEGAIAPELAELSGAMCRIAEALERPLIRVSLLIAVILDLFVSVLILLK